jgi:hypothetical protein
MDLLDQLIAVVFQGRGEVDLRLGQVVHRAQGERIQRDIRAALGERGHHHHRHGAQPHEILEEGDAVHLRHFHIQGDHIGVERFDLLARHVRIAGDAYDLNARVAPQDVGEQTAHQGGVVHDEDLDPACGARGGCGGAAVHVSCAYSNRSTSPPSAALLCRLSRYNCSW